MEKNLTHLREQLFETIELLKNNKISIENAKTISNTAQVIINSAKVEVDFLKLQIEAGVKPESDFLKLGK